MNITNSQWEKIKGTRIKRIKSHRYWSIKHKDFKNIYINPDTYKLINWIIKQGSVIKIDASGLTIDNSLIIGKTNKDDDINEHLVNAIHYMLKFKKHYNKKNKDKIKRMVELL